jgi:hypothetical protein
MKFLFFLHLTRIFNFAATENGWDDLFWLMEEFPSHPSSKIQKGVTN